MKVIRPFGPTIAKVKMSSDLVKKLNQYVDEIIVNEKKSNDQNYGKMLAGNVKQEFLLDKEFTVFSGWQNFLKENTEEWIFQSTKEKIQEFKIIDTWIVRQFENEYNPLHSHGGHISGVGYLKLPEDFGKTIQIDKQDNFNGQLQLVHGSKMFLSPITLNVKPEVGDFYFFPNYLMHCVYPFKNSNAERRSVSFNAWIDQKFYSVHGR
tara:strand:- start:1389 stop:2012 length:624 start_codon:yes stop_codon:yes gene_type:complete